MLGSLSLSGMCYLVHLYIVFCSCTTSILDSDHSVRTNRAWPYVEVLAFPSSTCLNGSERRALDPMAEVLNSMLTGVEFCCWLFSRSKTCDANIAITANSVCSWKTPFKIPFTLQNMNDSSVGNTVAEGYWGGRTEIFTFTAAMLKIRPKETEHNPCVKMSFVTCPRAYLLFSTTIFWNFFSWSIFCMANRDIRVFPKRFHWIRWIQWQ